MTRRSLSRRGFLKTGAASGAALVVGFRWSDALAQPAQEKQEPSPFDAWVRIDQAGATTLILAKSEMGQGVMTALPMILAEELNLDWSRVRVEQAPTNAKLYSHGTGGSGSVKSSWLPLRRAGAAARKMLIQAAASDWQVNPDTCTAENGYVVHGPRRKRLSYGELVEAASRLPVPDLATVPLESHQEFTIVGTSPPRVDVPAKVDGSAVFGLDVRVPGMLYAVVARCPRFGGRVKRFDGAQASAVSGVRHVLEIEPMEQGAHSAGGVVVVAENTWAALRGRKALEVEWDPGPRPDESTNGLGQRLRELASREGKRLRDEGDADAALAAAARKVEAAYELPFEAHATMEPMNATVDIRADRAEAWVPTQAPDWAQDMIARVSGLPAEKVVVHTTLMGGGFGRRYQADFVVEAAQVSKAVGAPVKLVWSREDDMRHDFYRPAAYHRLWAGLDAAGQLTAWKDRMVSVSIDAFWRPPDRQRPERTEQGGAIDLPYAIPNLRVEYAPAPSSVPVAWWRSVEHSINGFVIESFLDELAAAAGDDPLELRRRLLAGSRKVRQPPDGEDVLDTARLRGVLELAATRAGWGSPVLPGRGRGLAGHFSFATYVGQVAEVSVEKGEVRVHRVVCAVDCGRVVDPDGARAQVESAVVYGLSAVLGGGITVSAGRVEQGNFDAFEVLRIPEMPEVAVHFVESDAPPTGMGEPALPPLAAAVANAVFAVTGKRIRRLPIRAEDLA